MRRVVVVQSSLLCCVATVEEEEPKLSDHLQPRQNLDRVENAFKKFDLDQDGFLSWNEFKQVSWRGERGVVMDPVQIGLEQEAAARIFRYCDQVRRSWNKKVAISKKKPF